MKAPHPTAPRQAPDVPPTPGQWAKKFGRMLAQAKYRSKRNGRPFDLTRAHLERLYAARPTCALTGVPLTLANVSLDRIDSTQGYSPGNVQLATLTANRAKQDRPVIRTVDGREFAYGSAAHVEWERTARDAEALPAIGDAWERWGRSRRRKHRRTGRGRGRPRGSKPTKPATPKPVTAKPRPQYEPRDLSLSRAAAMLGVTPQAVSHWIRLGVKLPGGLELRLPRVYRPARGSTGWICPLALRTFLEAARSLSRPVPAELHALCDPDRLKAPFHWYDGARFIAKRPVDSRTCNDVQ